MQKTFATSICWLIAWAGPSLAQAPVKSEYYPLDKGHKWVYRVTDLQTPKAKADSKRQVVIEIVDTVRYSRKETIDGKVTDINLAGFILQLTNGDKVSRDHVFVSENGVHRFHAAGNPIDPPFLFFKFGLKKLGDTWQCSSTNGDKTIKGTCTLNQDDVNVPFLKLEIRKAVIVLFKADDDRGEIEYWFVKDIGMVKQRIKGKNLHLVMDLESANFVK